METTGTDIRIRKAKTADVPELLALKKEASTVLLARLGYDLDKIAAWHQKFAQETYMKAHVRSPNSLYVLEDDGSIEGMAGLSVKDDGDNSYIRFGNLYCRGHNQGHGSRLMEYRLGVSEHFNVDFIEANVNEKNDKARRFVEHYGFIECGKYFERTNGAVNLIYRRYQDD